MQCMLIFERIRSAAWTCGLVACALAAVLLLRTAGGASDKRIPPTVSAEPPAPPPTEAAELLRPGLSLTIQSLDANGQPVGPADTRSTRLIALHVPQGTAPSALAPPGRFRATWTGNLNLKLRERFSFRAEGRGSLRVVIAEKEALKVQGEDWSRVVGENVRLKKGANAAHITYESPAAGDAFVRLFWEQKAVRPEPIPPTVLMHDVNDGPTLAGNTLRAGRFKFAQLRCVKCHTAPESDPDNADSAMPELAMDAPSLKDAGARLQREWMTAWINSPDAMRPDAHMPRVFHDPNGSDDAIDPRAADVAAYLASLNAPPADAPAVAPDAQTIAHGGRLYASLLCAACHTAPDAPPDAPPLDAAALDATPLDSPLRVPLRHVKAKFTPDGLKKYLLAPEAHYLWNPMPNFKLNEKQASSLAAYLLSIEAAPLQLPPDAPAGDVERGKQLVMSSGCLNCHELDGASTLSALPLAQIPVDAWSRGCMAPDAEGRKHAPDYALSPAQRTTLLAFAATDRSSLSRDSAAEFSARQYEAMRCAACHPRDGAQPAITTRLSDEVLSFYKLHFPTEPTAQATAPTGQPPSAGGGAAADIGEKGQHLAPDQRSLPLLTWIGEKLRPEWSAAFMAGEIPYKPRPYLRARMPAFPARAELFARGFAAEHGYAPATEPYPAPDESLAPHGQKLIGAVGGFSCVQCHAVGEQPALAPFEAPAINFMYVTDRLRKDYYHRWMWSPLRVDPATKMPQFNDIEGKTALRDTLDGDATLQYEAIWQFLLNGKDVKVP